MDSTNLLEGLEQLDEDIDDLEESLESLVKTALSETTSKLPLLDKAKLYVLVTYAIESALFSYLRLNGVEARSHPVFTELTRVKQYFSKIKTAETPAKPANMALDLPAVSRFIKHGLAGNDKYDTERAERIAKEKAKAHIKFTQMSKKRKAEGSGEDEKEEEEEASSSESEPEEILDDGAADKELPGFEEVEAEEPKKRQQSHRSKKRNKKAKLSSEAVALAGDSKTSSDEKAPKSQRKAERAARRAEKEPETVPLSAAAKAAAKAEKKAEKNARKRARKERAKNGKAVDAA